VNQRAPREETICQGARSGVGSANLLKVPVVETLPIALLACAVNQRLPSGPAAIPTGSSRAAGTVNSLNVPLVVIRPILLVPDSVNQSLPSGPAVIPTGAVPPGN